jgi:ankyrin repeat protein
MKTIFDAIHADDPAAVAAFIDSDPNVFVSRDIRGYLPLHAAAQHGNIEIIQLLLARGAKIKAKKGNKSAVHFATYGGHEQAARYLLQQGAPLNFACNKGWTFLHEVLGNFFADVRAPGILIDLGADVTKLGKNYGVGSAPLHLAMKFQVTKVPQIEMRRYRRQVVEKLLDHGADPNQPNSEGDAPLHLAAGEGYADIVNLLLDRGAGVNIPDEDGATPLFFAMLKGDLATVRTLLDRGAKIDVRLAKSAGKYAGQTPLAVALEQNHRYIARLLRDRGATRPKWREVDTPSHKELHSACWFGQIDDVRMILDDDPQAVHSHTPAGFTQDSPLHRAAGAGHVDVCRLLIERGADLNDTSFGDTCPPICDAARHGHADVVRLLAESCADLNHNTSHRRALHEALYWGYLDVVRVLLEAGADPNILDTENRTPLYRALHGRLSDYNRDKIPACAELIRAHGGHE